MGGVVGSGSGERRATTAMAADKLSYLRGDFLNH